LKLVRASDLETKIILALGKKQKSQAEISREIGHDPKSVGKTVNRLEEQEILNRSKDYVKDSRISLIQLNRKKIKIKKTHDFYLRFFFIQIFTIILSIIFSFFMRKMVNFMLISFSTIISIIPSTIYMFYQVYVTKDKITVDKIVRERKKYKTKNNTDKGD